MATPETTKEMKPETKAELMKALEQAIAEIEEGKNDGRMDWTGTKPLFPIVSAINELGWEVRVRQGGVAGSVIYLEKRD